MAVVVEEILELPGTRTRSNTHSNKTRCEIGTYIFFCEWTMNFGENYMMNYDG